MNKFLFLLLILLSSVFSQENNNLEKLSKDLGSEDYNKRLNAKKEFDAAGLRAIPVLRKLLNSDELEIKEYAEKRVSDSIFYEQEQFKIENMIGVDGKRVPIQKYLNEYYRLLKDFFIRSYEKNSAKNPKWDKQIKSLSNLWVEYYFNLDLDNEISDVYHASRSYRKNEKEIRILINEISALGCDDPFFIFLTQSLYFVWNDYRFSIDQLCKTTEAMGKLNYSHYFEFFSSIRARSLKPSNNKDKEMNPYLKNAFEHWVELGKDDLLKNRLVQRRYIGWLKNISEEVSLEAWEKNLDTISANAVKDSWLDHCLKAQFYLKKTWIYRNKQNENNNQEENTKIYNSSFEEAENHCLAAYQINPEFPESIVQMIQICTTKPNRERIRLWFEKGIKAEINNYPLFTIYNWALDARWGGSFESMLSLGREYLIVNQPDLNMAKFYMYSLKTIGIAGGDVSKNPGVLSEVEWAAEQQIASKPVYSNLYNNDIAVYAILNSDYTKAWKAIQNLKGLFSAGWYDFNINSSFMERYVLLAEKYKDNKVGEALRSFNPMQLEYSDDKIRLLLDQMDQKMDGIDKSKLVNILMNLKILNLEGSEEKIIDLLFENGYREASLLSYIKISQVPIREKLRPKLIERFGLRTIESVEVIDKFVPAGSDPFAEINDKIKAVFIKDVKELKDLEKNDEYNKAQVRGQLYCYKDKAVTDKTNNRKIKDSILSFASKIKNAGDAGDFVCTVMYSYLNPNNQFLLSDLYRKYFFKFSDLNLDNIEYEINRLSLIQDDLKLVEEVRKTWFEIGTPLLTFEIINLLRNRKLNVEAEILSNWMFCCLEEYTKTGDNQAALFFLSQYPGYHKEAYQIGVKLIRNNGTNVTSYLVAYHLFMLGQHHLAYEILCKGQTMREYGNVVLFNKKFYQKSDDLLQAIVNIMLESKDLPEYIRFNLKDQFDLKFKKEAAK